MRIRLSDEEVLVVGRLIKDAEYKRVGSKNIPYCRFALNAGKPEDPLINCVAWRSTAESCASYKKGEHVLVLGTISTRVYNGKTYKDLTVEFSASQTQAASTPPFDMDALPDAHDDIEDLF